MELKVIASTSWPLSKPLRLFSHYYLKKRWKIENNEGWQNPCKTKNYLGKNKWNKKEESGKLKKWGWNASRFETCKNVTACYWANNTWFSTSKIQTLRIWVLEVKIVPFVIASLSQNFHQPPNPMNSSGTEEKTHQKKYNYSYVIKEVIKKHNLQKTRN